LTQAQENVTVAAAEKAAGLTTQLASTQLSIDQIAAQISIAGSREAARLAYEKSATQEAYQTTTERITTDAANARLQMRDLLAQASLGTHQYREDVSSNAAVTIASFSRDLEEVRRKRTYLTENKAWFVTAAGLGAGGNMLSSFSTFVNSLAAAKQPTLTTLSTYTGGGGSGGNVAQMT
jgi:hypothetical protein